MHFEEEKESKGKFLKLLIVLIIPVVGILTFVYLTLSAASRDDTEQTTPDTDYEYIEPIIDSYLFYESIWYGPTINTTEFMITFIESFLSQITQDATREDQLEIFVDYDSFTNTVIINTLLNGQYWSYYTYFIS